MLDRELVEHFFMNPRLSTTLLSGLFLSVCGIAQADSFLRADYYVWNRFEKQGGPNARQIKDIEALIFFSPLVPDKEGKLTIDKPFEEALAKLKKAKKPKSKIWLGLGDLRIVSGNAKAMNVLAANVVKICKKYGFAGVDVDWEGNPDIKPEVYAEVIKALSLKCRAAGLDMAISVGTGQHYSDKAIAAQKYLDYINIQFYYSTINALSLEDLKKVLARFEKGDIPRKKLLIGLPVYGMVDMSKNRNAKPVAISYKTIMEKGGDPSKNTWVNPDTGVTYFYSGKPLMLDKVNYAKKNGYGGVFTWELTMDADYGDPSSLLKAIDDACKAR